MNISLKALPPVIKVCVTNPHTTYARLLLARLFSGKIYGDEQEISVILHTKMERLQEMEGLKVQLENCAFSLNAGIEVVHDIKTAIKDIHVLVLMSSMEALRSLEQIEVNEEILESTLDAIFDIRACATAMAGKLPKPCAGGDIEEKTWNIPLVATDCLIALTIFAHYAGPDYPREKIFCSTSLTTVARFVLVTHLDVLTSQLNHVYVWAADNNALHVEADEPLINFKEDDNECGPKLVQKEMLASKNMDITDFNESWMKSHLLEKTRARASQNPLGPISSAHTLAALLTDISSLVLHGRENPDDPERACKERDRVPQVTKVNAGILSDGSYGVAAGLPCVFPLIITDATWEIDQKHCNSLFVKKVMQQLKGAAKNNRNKIIALCAAAALQGQEVVSPISPVYYGSPTTTSDYSSREVPANSREEYVSSATTDYTSGRASSGNVGSN